MTVVAKARSEAVLNGSTTRFTTIPDGTSEGVVGLLVADFEGRLLALSARHTLGISRRLSVRGESGRLLGERVFGNVITSKPQPASDGIGFFEVSSKMLAAAPGFSKVFPTRELDSVLGEVVWKLDWRGMQPAQVSRLHCSLRLVPRRGKPARLYDAIEVEPLDPDHFAVDGDSGALIVADQNTPLGILIAGTDSRYFIALLAPLFERRQLRIANADDVAIHNMSAISEMFDLARIERSLIDLVNSLSDPAPPRKLIDEISIASPFPAFPETEVEMSPLARALSRLGTRK